MSWKKFRRKNMHWSLSFYPKVLSLIKNSKDFRRQMRTIRSRFKISRILSISTTAKTTNNLSKSTFLFKIKSLRAQSSQLCHFKTSSYLVRYFPSISTLFLSNPPWCQFYQIWSNLKIRRVSTISSLFWTFKWNS